MSRRMSASFFLVFVSLLSSVNSLPFFGLPAAPVFNLVGQGLGALGNIPGARPVIQPVTQGLGVVEKMTTNPIGATQDALNMIPGAGNVVNPLFQTLNQITQIQPINQAIQPGLGAMKVATDAVNTHVIGNVKMVDNLVKSNIQNIQNQINQSPFGFPLTNSLNSFAKGDPIAGVIELLSGGITLAMGQGKRPQQQNQPQMTPQQQQQQQQQLAPDYSDMNEKWTSLDDYVKVFYVSRITAQDYNGLLAILNPTNRSYLQNLVAKVKAMPSKNQQNYIMEGYNRYVKLSKTFPPSNSPPSTPVAATSSAPPTMAKPATTAKAPSPPPSAPNTSKPTIGNSKPMPTPIKAPPPPPPVKAPSPPTPATGNWGMDGSNGMDNVSAGSTGPTGMGTWNESNDMYMGNGMDDFPVHSNEKKPKSKYEDEFDADDMDMGDIPVPPGWRTSIKPSKPSNLRNMPFSSNSKSSHSNSRALSMEDLDRW